MRNLLHALGPLRLLLLALVAVSALSAPFAGGEVRYEFPAVLSTLVAPPLAVMLAFIVALDALMTVLFMRGGGRAAQPRYRRVLAAEVVALALLAAVWTPFFRELASR